MGRKSTRYHICCFCQNFVGCALILCLVFDEERIVFNCQSSMQQKLLFWHLLHGVNIKRAEGTSFIRNLDSLSHPKTSPLKGHAKIRSFAVVRGALVFCRILTRSEFFRSATKSFVNHPSPYKNINRWCRLLWTLERQFKGTVSISVWKFGLLPTYGLNMVAFVHLNNLGNLAAMIGVWFTGTRDRLLIKSAMDNIQDNTCIRFHEKTEADQDHIVIAPGLKT